MKCALFILACCIFSAQAAESDQVFAKVQLSVVTVITRDEKNQVDMEGSGVVVAAKRVITNCHVVQEANVIQIRWGDKILPAALALSDVTRDLCQLDVPSLSAPPAKIRSYRELRTGEEIYTVGNPLGLGLAVATGLVSRVGQYKDETRIYISAQVSPGSSGGGLFDAQGRLVGIVTAFLSQGQNLNIAMPADWIAEIPSRAKPILKAVPDHSPDPDWQNEAEVLRQSRNWEKLNQQSHLWLAAYPTSAPANYYLGLALYNLNRDHEAEQAFLRALRLDPFYATGYGGMAVTHLRLGNTDAAQKEIKQAMQLDPSNGYYWRVQADIQHHAAQINEAVASMQMAIKLNPGDEANWAYLGGLLLKQGNSAEAIKAEQTALRLNPNFAQASSLLATAQASLGQVAAAQHSLIAATGGKTETGTWVILGNEEAKQNHHAEAERMYRKALELDPESAIAWYGLAQSLQSLSRNADAEDALHQAIKNQPKFENAWGILGNLLKTRGDHKGAITAYEKIVSINPANLAAWLALGAEKESLKDFSGAANAVTKATQLDPANFTAWAALGSSQIKLGQWEEALKSLTEAEQLNPESAYVNQLLATYHGMRGNHQESLAYSDKLLSINSADPLFWSTKGYNLLKLQRYPEAIQALETAIKLDPKFGNAWINLGETYLRQQQLGKAITTLEYSLKLLPDAPDARMYLAQAYNRSGQGIKAIENLDVLLKRQPNYAPALYMLTVIYLNQGNQSEGLETYTRLKTVAPAMARDLRDKNRAQGVPQKFVLPD